MCDTSGPNTGAIISLNAIGKQDTYLLEDDPDHSFFKYNVKKHSNLLDYSYIYEEINFFDNVHVDQQSREKISTLMVKDLQSIILKKC